MANKYQQRSQGGEGGGYGRNEPVPDPKRTAPKVDLLALPMDSARKEVENCLANHDNAIIMAETGSGKTTRTPIILLEANPDARIAVTQPRRVAAISVADYVAECQGERVGGKIGSQVRFDNETSKETRVIFMTDGILLAKLKADPLL
jgi:HrpA-like RNA helicase